MKMNLGGGMKMNGCLCKFFIMSILRVLKWRMKLYCVDDVVQKKWTIWWIGERCRAPYACSVQFDVRYSAPHGSDLNPSRPLARWTTGWPPYTPLNTECALQHLPISSLALTPIKHFLPNATTQSHRGSCLRPFLLFGHVLGFFFFSCRLYVYTL